MSELQLLADFRQSFSPIAFVRQRVGVRALKFFHHLALRHEPHVCVALGKIIRRKNKFFLTEKSAISHCDQRRIFLLLFAIRRRFD